MLEIEIFLVLDQRRPVAVKSLGKTGSCNPGFAMSVLSARCAPSQVASELENCGLEATLEALVLARLPRLALRAVLGQMSFVYSTPSIRDLHDAISGPSFCLAGHNQSAVAVVGHPGDAAAPSRLGFSGINQ